MKRFKVVLSVGLTLGSLILLLFILGGIGFETIYNTMIKANPVYLVLSFLSILLMFCAWNLKWQMITKKVTDVSFFSLLPILITGTFFNTVTPGARVGGAPIRLHYLSKYTKKRKSIIFPTVALDQATNMLAFYLLCCLSILFVVLFLKINYIIKILLEVFLIITLVVILSGLLLKNKIRFKIMSFNGRNILSKIYYFPLLTIIRNKFDTYNKFEAYIMEKMNNVLSSFKKLLKDDTLFKRNIGFSFLIWLLNYIATYMLFLAFGQEINISAVIVVVTLSTLLGSVLIVPGGIGITETAMISLYASFGISPEIGATVAVIDRFIYYFYSLIIGFFCFVYMQIKYK